MIQQELKEYTEIPYAHGDLQCRLIISEDRNDFLLITQGWEDDVQIHGCLVHIEIIGDKIWIHRDGLEDGIASDLLRGGIPIFQLSVISYQLFQEFMDINKSIAISVIS
ncbi:MAG: XisI protein [Okeania sp. SIO2F4]|nr:element excision factor XisI family protein [Okeania sp. SIO2F4]NES04021.1 XisI protein [Okeania sp. SIO2F4]